MDIFQAIGLIAACLTVGATLMHAHYWAVGQAVAHERQKADAQAQQLRAERDSYRRLHEAAVQTIQQLRLEQANSAGYEDGYRAAYKDAEAEGFSASVNDAIYTGLRDGSSVSLRILNHH